MCRGGGGARCQLSESEGEKGRAAGSRGMGSWRRAEARQGLEAPVWVRMPGSRSHCGMGF